MQSEVEPEESQDILEPNEGPPSLLLQNRPEKNFQIEDVNKIFAEGMTTFQKFVKAKMAPPATVPPGQEFGQTVGSFFNSLNQRHQKEAKRKLHIMKYVFIFIT
jgi:hypothetical protein